MLGKAVNWFLILIAVVSSRVIVCVLFLNHFPFLVIKQLQIWIKICQPFMSVNLLNSKSFLRIDF